MSLKTSYRFIALIYDAFIERATRSARQRSLSPLPQQGAARVLVSGAGTGLDFPFLPPCHDYIALDLTAAMLARSRGRAHSLRMAWVWGDSMALPFADGSFDYVVLHLIVAVVSEPQRCLAEAARVLKPGGRIPIRQVSTLRATGMAAARHESAGWANGHTVRRGVRRCAGSCAGVACIVGSACVGARLAPLD